RDVDRLSVWGGEFGQRHPLADGCDNIEQLAFDKQPAVRNINNDCSRRLNADKGLPDAPDVIEVYDLQTAIFQIDGQHAAGEVRYAARTAIAKTTRDTIDNASSGGLRGLRDGGNRSCGANGKHCELSRKPGRVRGSKGLCRYEACRLAPHFMKNLYWQC